MKSWVREFKGIFQSKERPTKAFCTVCIVDFGIGHGGAPTFVGTWKTIYCARSCHVFAATQI